MHYLVGALIKNHVLKEATLCIGVLYHSRNTIKSTEFVIFFRKDFLESSSLRVKLFMIKPGIALARTENTKDLYTNKRFDETVGKPQHDEGNVWKSHILHSQL